MSHNGTTILFGLRGVRVREVERVAGGGRVVRVVTDDPGASACPVCGVFSSSVRQRRTTGPRDLPYGEELLVVRWHKVQYACREELCARKAFTEQIGEVPAGARVTGRLRRAAGKAVGGGQAVTGAGRGLRDQLGDFVTVNGLSVRISEINNTHAKVTQNVPAGNDLTIAYRNPTWKRFGALES